MDLTDGLVNLGGIVLMALVAWWFWRAARNDNAYRAQSGEIVNIVVDHGVYDPALIEIAAGQQLQLRFERRDTRPCAERVVFHGLDISQALSVRETTLLTLTPEEPGDYRFTCQKGVYRGRLIVR